MHRSSTRHLIESVCLCTSPHTDRSQWVLSHAAQKPVLARLAKVLHPDTSSGRRLQDDKSRCGGRRLWIVWRVAMAAKNNSTHHSLFFETKTTPLHSIWQDDECRSQGGSGQGGIHDPRRKWDQKSTRFVRYGGHQGACRLVSACQFLRDHKRAPRRWKESVCVMLWAIESYRPSSRKCLGCAVSGPCRCIQCAGYGSIEYLPATVIRVVGLRTRGVPDASTWTSMGLGVEAGSRHVTEIG